MIDGLLIAILALAGLCVGSFVTTAAIRATRQQAFLSGRSHCDACGAPLSFAATTPILGYISRRGRCAVCSAAIDPTHLVGEGLGALALVLPFVILPWPRASLVAGLGFVLLGASVYDLKTQRLPNLLMALAAILGTTLAALHGSLALIEGLIAAAIAGLLLEALRLAFRKRRGDPGLGFGDVKLIAALAIWLGAASPWMVVAGSGLGLLSIAVRRERPERIAFGPFIAAAGFGVGLLQEALAWPLLL